MKGDKKSSWCHDNSSTHVSPNVFLLLYHTFFQLFFSCSPLCWPGWADHVLETLRGLACSVHLTSIVSKLLVHVLWRTPGLLASPITIILQGATAPPPSHGFCLDHRMVASCPVITRFSPGILSQPPPWTWPGWALSPNDCNKHLFTLKCDRNNQLTKS
jgi:hypothetical protein